MDYVGIALPTKQRQIRILTEASEVVPSRMGASRQSLPAAWYRRRSHAANGSSRGVLAPGPCSGPPAAGQIPVSAHLHKSEPPMAAIG
jgi:hypothetical protein